jgi:peptide-methionine (R)-S-oxide reductase
LVPRLVFVLAGLALVGAIIPACSEQSPGSPAMSNAKNNPPSVSATGVPTTQGSAAACSVDGGGACGTTHWAQKTEAEWRKQLTPEQFAVAREAATERAFTGKYWHTKTPGVYQCACCGQELFSSDAKFDSGTGWPSFWQPIAPGRVTTKEDRSLGMTRVEVLCSQCGAHLGHLFDDGPKPTGQRYCINSAVLNLVTKDASEKGK